MDNAAQAHPRPGKADRVYYALLDKISNWNAKVAVVGLGYVGVPLALTLAEHGVSVVGYDVDQGKVDQLQDGACYLPHIFAKRVSEAVSSGLFRATTDRLALRQADVVIMALPTPVDEDKNPDMRAIESVVQTLKSVARTGQLIILESTVYPGATEEYLRRPMEELGFVIGETLFIGYSPEREDPGNGEYNTGSIPKIVSGFGEFSLSLTASVYQSAGVATVPVSSVAVAETAKLMENVFRFVNISLVNELKEQLEGLGVNVWEVISAAATKPFGYMPFWPGPGIGGHCIPVDPYYLQAALKKCGALSRMIRTAGDINDRMPIRVARQAIEAILDVKGALAGSKALVVGLAYKKNVDDCRESPAVEVLGYLAHNGVEVDYHDPHVPEFDGRKSQSWSFSTISEYDVVVVCTDHDVIDFVGLGKAARCVVDSRNAVKEGAHVIRA